MLFITRLRMKKSIEWQNELTSAFSNKAEFQELEKLNLSEPTSRRKMSLLLSDSPKPTFQESHPFGEDCNSLRDRALLKYGLYRGCVPSRMGELYQLQPVLRADSGVQ